MFIHHNGLRVNAELPDHVTVEALAIYADAGWETGEHPDTDRDDPAALRRVLPPPTVADVVQAVKAPTKKGS